MMRIFIYKFSQKIHVSKYILLKPLEEMFPGNGFVSDILIVLVTASEEFNPLGTGTFMTIAIQKYINKK